MKEVCSFENCSGCSACCAVCPVECIVMQSNQEGFEYPVVDIEMCIKCSACKVVCPSLHPYDASKVLKTFLCKNIDDSVRLASSSGGVFSLFAAHYISQGGIVYGAKLNDELECEHGEAITLGECNEFRGSKYVQSRLNNVFHKVKHNLEAEKPVLFTGTPCHIAGLKHYLRKDYEQLLCVDLVCHGVPSPGVYSLYIKGLKAKYDSIMSIQFRHKKKGWYNVSDMLINFADGSTQRLRNDRFLLGFLLNTYLRPSCYACKANGLRSGSDITIADYWGSETKFPLHDDKQGVSLVLAKSVKGIDVVQKIKKNAVLEESTLEHAVLFNKTVFTSSRQNVNREAFFKDYAQSNMSFDELAQKYIRLSSAPLTGIAIIIKRIFGYRFYNMLWKVVMEKRQTPE